MIEIGLLGTVQTTVRGDDGVAQVGLSYLERSLVAALACSPEQVVTADRLVDVLWEESPPIGARTRVQGLVSSLRKRLAAAGGDPCVLATDPSGYVLRVGKGCIDVECFRDLVQGALTVVERGDLDAAADMWQSALRLWRGPAFDGVRSYALQAEAVGLEEMRMTALEHRINADLHAGRYERVIPELTRLRAQHPGRERLVGQLMTALHATDRHAEALGAYRTLQQHLREEHGTSPGPRLRRIHELLLRGTVEPWELLATLVDCRPVLASKSTGSSVASRPHSAFAAR